MQRVAEVGRYGQYEFSTRGPGRSVPYALPPQGGFTRGRYHSVQRFSAGRTIFASAGHEKAC